ncbi:MAG: glycosyltransferase family 2 protein [Alphaproteobacteria bacterium]
MAAPVRGRIETRGFDHSQTGPCGADAMRAPAHVPRVSVLIPVRDGEPFLREAVDSILDQTFSDFELLFIDDGSIDGTAAILEAYARGDRRVRVLHNATKLGLTASLNLGLRATRGEYVARMDHDDWSHPDRLLRQVAFLDTNPGIILVGTSFATIDGGGRTRKVDIEATTWWEFEWMSMFRPPVCHPTVMLRASLFREFGAYYDETYVVGQDFDYWCRALDHGRGCVLRDVLFNYRSHPASVSATKRDQQRDGFYRTATTQFRRRMPHRADLYDPIDRFNECLHRDHPVTVRDALGMVRTILAAAADFAAMRGLTNREHRTLLRLATRWIVLGLVVRGGLKDKPAAFARFLAGTTSLFPYVAAEAVLYLCRRLRLISLMS